MKKLIAGLALFTAFTCQAEDTVRGFLSGDAFLRLPVTSQEAFVMGLFDAGVQMCVPPRVKSLQLLAVMKLYLDKHPESWHMSAFGLYILAIRESFGEYPNCK